MLPSAGKIENEKTCGRPLGIRIKDGYLYAVDAYLGIFRTDLETGWFLNGIDEYK